MRSTIKKIAAMGNRNSKSTLRNAITMLSISADHIHLKDDKFWSQFWSEDADIAADIINSKSTQEIRMLRDGSPRNFAFLAYKMVELFDLATGTLCNTNSQQTAILNATRILTRIIPCLFEDESWQRYFEQNTLFNGSDGDFPTDDHVRFARKSSIEKDYASYLPTQIRPSLTVSEHRTSMDDTKQAACYNISSNTTEPVSNDNSLIELDNDLNFHPNLESKIKSKSETKEESNHVNLHGRQTSEVSLMQSLMISICDLLFCPEFTVSPQCDSYLSNRVDAPPEDLKSLNTCDYIWEPGVGFDLSSNSTTYHDKSRSVLLRLLLTCTSSSLYNTPYDSVSQTNCWIELLASSHNRHALPLFTSFLNTVFTYKPTSGSLNPFNSMLFEDSRSELVELCIQILIAILDYHTSEGGGDEPIRQETNDKPTRNLFIEYLSRIHREKDFRFLIQGFARLLNMRFEQGSMSSSNSQIKFEQELLILFWKISNHNKKFVAYLLRSKDALNIVLPILRHLNENYQDTSQMALTHIGVFNLLVLSGERNFGILLNHPYQTGRLNDLPEFSGTFSDLLIIVFHKLILYGRDLNQLYDFLLTIVVNISPYVKSLTMLASRCLIQLFEVFSSSFVIFTEPNYHELIIFLLDIFNNLIEYQFDGNVSLVYLILNKRHLFENLANLPTTSERIHKVLKKLMKTRLRNQQLIMGEQNSVGGVDMGQTATTELDGSFRKYQGAKTERETQLACSESQAKGVTPPTRSEIPMVATPSIHDVTQPVFPFDCIESPASGSKPINHVVVKPKSHNELNTNSCQHGSDHSILDDLMLDPETNGFEKGPRESSIENRDDEQEMSVPCKNDNVTTLASEGPSSSSSSSSRPLTADIKWSPTPDWALNWKRTLPLQTILRMIEALEPQLSQFKSENPSLTSKDLEVATIKLLQKGTLVGLLPVPHPILIRKYRTNHETTLWFRVCTWATIYALNSIWKDTKVLLFQPIT